MVRKHCAPLPDRRRWGNLSEWCPGLITAVTPVCYCPKKEDETGMERHADVRTALA